MFAAIYLGITLYPITPIARVYELDQLMDTLGPLFIFTTKSDRQTVRFVAVLDDNHNVYVPFKSLLSEGQNQILDTIPHFAVKPKKDICILLQSSGTTGAPKSVMISHTAFVAALMAFIKPDMNDESGGNNRTSPLVGFQMTQFSCMSGVAVLFGYATGAVSQVIANERDDRMIFKAIQDYGVNFMGMVPAFGHKLLNEMCDEYDLSSLKALMVTGAAFAANVAKDIMQKHKVSVVEVYGMTEYCGLTSPDGEYIPGCVGRPSDNTDMKVIDSKGNSLGPDLDGELCVRGPKLFSGYLNNVLATNEAIDDHGWLRTGDIGHYDSRHRFFITDRLKELIKYGTKQVSPTELEQFLLTHEAVAEAVVNIIDKQMELNRLATISMDIYMVTAVLSRASHTMVTGVRNSDIDKETAIAVSMDAFLNTTKLLDEMLGDSCTSNDFRNTMIHNRNMKFDGYFAMPTIDRII
ncbi:unnamed protein product, partial [Medioppia subpectinata]